MQQFAPIATPPEPVVFIPAEAARRAGGGGDLRIGLGCEAPRVGDAKVFEDLIGSLIAHGPVRLTARPDLPVTVEIAIRQTPELPSLPPCSDVFHDGRLLRIVIPLAEIETRPPASPERDLRLADHRFLVADDSATNRLILSEMLTGAGAQVDLAASGHEAVGLACSNRYDLLLLDISMPGMGGREALCAMRAASCDTPAFAVTANAMSHQVAEYLGAGFSGHLAKPLAYDHLVATLAEFLA